MLNAETVVGVELQETATVGEGQEEMGAMSYLQKVACMQLSQLEKAVLASLALF